jgi:hypothetical protein
VRRLLLVLACGILLASCSSGNSGTEQTDDTRSLTVSIDAGFEPLGDGTECKSALAGQQVRLTDASGTIVGIAAVPSTAPRTGSTKTGIAGINVGTCEVAVEINDIQSTSAFFTIDLGVGTLDYSASELDSRDWNVTVSATAMNGVWTVEKS